MQRKILPYIVLALTLLLSDCGGGGSGGGAAPPSPIACVPACNTATQYCDTSVGQCKNKPPKTCSPSCNADYQTCDTGTGSCVDKPLLNKNRCDIAKNYLKTNGFLSTDPDHPEDGMEPLSDYSVDPPITFTFNPYTDQETDLPADGASIKATDVDVNVHPTYPNMIMVYTNCGCNNLNSSQNNLANTLNNDPENPNKYLCLNGNYTDVTRQINTLLNSLADFYN